MTIKRLLASIAFQTLIIPQFGGNYIISQPNQPAPLEVTPLNDGDYLLSGPQPGMLIRQPSTGGWLYINPDEPKPSEVPQRQLPE